MTKKDVAGWCCVQNRGGGEGEDTETRYEKSVSVVSNDMTSFYQIIQIENVYVWDCRKWCSDLGIVVWFGKDRKDVVPACMKLLREKAGREEKNHPTLSVFRSIVVVFFFTGVVLCYWSAHAASSSWTVIVISWWMAFCELAKDQMLFSLRPPSVWNITIHQ